MNPAEALHAATHLNAEQIEKIVDELVPMIAAPEDHAFFRGILTIKAENSTSSEFAHFVTKLLTGAGLTT